MARRIVRESIYERTCKERQVKSVFTINYGIDRNFHSRKHMEQKKKTLTITFGANKPKTVNKVFVRKTTELGAPESLFGKILQ